MKGERVKIIKAETEKRRVEGTEKERDTERYEGILWTKINVS